MNKIVCLLKNMVQPTLSRLNINDLKDFSVDISLEYYAKYFGLDEFTEDVFPLMYEFIDKEQQKDKALVKSLQKKQCKRLLWRRY